jgi:hypothetical protein
MARIPSAKPTVRKISARALSYALAGAEQPYPVYQFSDVNKYERPGRNPFAFAATPDVQVTETPTNT